MAGNPRPIATVGDVIAYMLDRGLNVVSVNPMTYTFCGVQQAVRKAVVMHLINAKHTTSGDLLLMWNV